jgi:DNA-directed RNA polymerase specialized sigma24 family protein
MPVSSPKVNEPTRFRGEGSFAGWLFQIARNEVRNVQRKSPWPDNPEAEKLRFTTRAWEDEKLRRAAVEREVAPQVRAEKERAVWFMPEEKIWEVDQASCYRGQIGNRGPETALDVTAQMVAETGEPSAESVLVGTLEAEQSTQREFQVMTPHPRALREALVARRVRRGVQLHPGPRFTRRTPSRRAPLLPLVNGLRSVAQRRWTWPGVRCSAWRSARRPTHCDKSKSQHEA